MHYFLRLICLVTLLIGVARTEAEETFFPPLPQAMAVLGDSMSEGMFAEFSLEKRPSASQLATLLWITSDKDPARRMLGYRKYFARKEMSWATGHRSDDLVLSHYERLKALRPDIRAYNFAISGSETEELQGELEALFQTEETEGLNFDYVLFMMGANDLAAENASQIVPAERYLENIENAIRKLLHRNSLRAILFVGLPDVHTVFERSQDFVAYKYWYDELKCGSMRKKVYGNKSIFNPSNPVEYEATKRILQQYRLGLSDLVTRLSMEYPESALLYIQDYRLPTNIKKALSIDCFHPSEWGQAELAELTWMHGFWPQIQPSDFSGWSSPD